MSGYLDDGGAPVSDAEAAGWLPTGDLGTLDADGFLSVVGRVRDLILCGGFNIYPAHVEAALNRLPDVADSAVAGLPDERLGEVPVAAVVSRPGVTLDPERIRTELRAELAAYELPRKLIQVSAVPRFDTGKVDRDAVRRAVEQALTAGSSR
jgi:fatty-acyl-CoA synthase/O-succinylbenzoic acid--CoA ligase